MSRKVGAVVVGFISVLLIVMALLYSGNITQTLAFGSYDEVLHSLVIFLLLLSLGGNLLLIAGILYRHSVKVFLHPNLGFIYIGETAYCIALVMLSLEINRVIPSKEFAALFLVTSLFSAIISFFWVDHLEKTSQLGKRKQKQRPQEKESVLANRLSDSADESEISDISDERHANDSQQVENK